MTTRTSNQTNKKQQVKLINNQKVMKKYFILAAAAIVALAACTKSEVNTPAQREISYNAVTAKNTVSKAIIDHSFYAPNDPAFGIWALYQPTNWSTDKNVSNFWVGTAANASAQITNTTETAAGYWKNAAGIDYWPISGKLVFMGYSPYAHVSSKATIGKGTGDDAGKVLLTVTDFNSATGDWVDDLMYSDPVEKDANDTNYDPDGAPTTTYEGVPVVFHHALSMITIKARAAAAYTGYTFTINSITLTIDDKATLTALAAPGSSAVPSWTEADTEASKTLTLTSAASSGLTTSYVAMSEPVLVIPQTLDASAGEGYDKLVINYTLTHNEVASTTEKTIYIKKASTLDELVKNTKYNLNLEFSLTEIKYSPDIMPWDSAADTEYNVPGNAV